VANMTAGSAGLLQTAGGAPQAFSHFELHRSPPLVADKYLERKLYDAEGRYRGEISGGETLFPMETYGTSSWDKFGKEKIILLDAYRPERAPYSLDWILVLERQSKFDKRNTQAH
jgi:hypothetical protein